MPLGGGGSGLNVWVENGDVLFYVMRSGSFDENNTFPKLGRIRLRFSPNPFNGKTFEQHLHLKDGYITIDGRIGNAPLRLMIWVDAFRPLVHMQADSRGKFRMEAFYESWRFADRSVGKTENNQDSYKWAAPDPVVTYRDSISFYGKTGIVFFHNNADHQSVFDKTVQEQMLDSVKDQIPNPLSHLIFGGQLYGPGFHCNATQKGYYLSTPFRSWSLRTGLSKHHDLHLLLYVGKNTPSGFLSELSKLNILVRPALLRQSFEKTVNWWHQFWNRSFIEGVGREGSDSLKNALRNYQLFRYMLGCNAGGSYPTKFNGGLFTFDPELVKKELSFTPDFRNWGGGTFTAQNQRLVYFPMLKSGDYDLLRTALDFYVRLLGVAELRTQVYWHHAGACYTEQLENFGLPNPSEYGWKRPAYFDPGVEYNAWLEYHWDTVLEFCLLALDGGSYGQLPLSDYLPFVESCIRFFDIHYRYLNSRLSRKALDGKGKLILYPGSAGETYKLAYNSTTTVSALKVLVARILRLPDSLLSLPDRNYFDSLEKRLPEVPLRTLDGHLSLAPAELWSRVQNQETPQLYPVFPWHLYSLGSQDLAVAKNTWNYDTLAIRNRSYIGWKQDAIFAADMGLTKEAFSLTLKKLSSGPFRFPAFWGPGFDWAPDHNWGGSGMIALQDMLLQCQGGKILLFPSWPADQDVHFRLHATDATIVEAMLKGGKLVSLQVWPESRRKDVLNYLDRKP